MVDTRFFSHRDPLTLEKIISLTNCKVVGTTDYQRLVVSVSPLNQAKPGDLSFFANHKYLDDFKSSRAEFCFTSDKFVSLAPANMVVLVSDQPYRDYAIIASELVSVRLSEPYIANSAKIAANAVIGRNCSIGENVVIEDEVEIGDDSYIGHNSVIHRGVKIGKNSNIASNVTISFSIIGDRVIIHSGVRIGQDGFGFASDSRGHHKVPQLGRVIIGNDVEIGANTTIDRGAGPDTIISDMTKIDNLVQIGHNVKIGKGCILVSQVGVAGSVEIGNFVALGGQVGVAGHIKIGDYVQVAAQGGVIQNIASKEIVGGTPTVPIKDWHKQSVMLKKMIKKKV